LFLVQGGMSTPGEEMRQKACLSILPRMQPR
jgi:hypothetical protein